MDELKPGHYWKTPFYWQPGGPPPPERGALAFEPADDAWLRDAIGQAMAAGADESDRHTVQRLGLAAAVQEVFDTVPAFFTPTAAGWRAAVDGHGARVGFVMPALFTEARFARDGQPQGTIVYIGVLPALRGRGHAVDLVHEATRVLRGAGCWRIFCDTGTLNAAMVAAFRRAGYEERAPWQRPLAWS